MRKTMSLEQTKHSSILLKMSGMAIVFALCLLSVGCATTTKFDPRAIADGDVIAIVPTCYQTLSYSRVDQDAARIADDMLQHRQDIVGHDEVVAFARLAEKALGRPVKILDARDIVLTSDGRYRDDAATAEKAGAAVLMWISIGTEIYSRNHYAVNLWGRMWYKKEDRMIWQDRARTSSLGESFPQPVTRETVSNWVLKNIPALSGELANSLVPHW